MFFFVSSHINISTYQSTIYTLALELETTQVFLCHRSQINATDHLLCTDAVV